MMSLYGGDGADGNGENDDGGDGVLLFMEVMAMIVLMEVLGQIL